MTSRSRRRRPSDCRMIALDRTEAAAAARRAEIREELGVRRAVVPTPVPGHLAAADRLATSGEA
ncbi:hypothetical protein ACFVXA_31285 [Streptomyces sp. NPDC058246]|uniref:hypothetical protein n=1 Tax=Streptomyces sp. NPDC058246 TaxID=3346400 RepID=UPI0036EEBD8E